MTYMALYRTWRPQRFADLIGQLHVSRTLMNAIKNNRLAHAYLFSGPRGTGKTSSAKILAKALNCLNLTDGEPCNQCAHCLAINEDNFFDVLEIDAASNRGIDEIRDIRDKVKFAPTQGKTKVYIIDEVHMLTTEAFNALLKTLEEPPEKVVFILATTEPQKLPPTITSRCQRFDFRKITDHEIKKHLQLIANRSQISISEQALDIISRKAAGGMRDAISILDQCIAFAGNSITEADVETVLGILAEEQIFGILQGLFQKNIQIVLSKLNEFIQSGKDIKQIIIDLIGYTRQLLLYKVSLNEDLLTGNQQLAERAKGEVADLSLEYLGQVIHKLTEVEREMRFHDQPHILLEIALISLALNDFQPVAPKPASPKKTTDRKPKTTIRTIPDETKDSSQDVVAKKPAVMQELREPNLQVIQNLWPKILEEIKNERIRIHAFLIPAAPINLQGSSLELSFKAGYNFHRDRFLDSANREAVEDAIAKITGMRVQIKIGKNTIVEPEEDQEPESMLVQKALELFDGDIVETND